MDFQTCFSPTKCTSQKKDRLFPEDRSPQKYYPSPKFKKTSPKYNTDLYESLINQNNPDQIFIKSSPIREISSPKFKGKYTFLTNPNVHPVISLNVPSVSSDFYIHPIDWSKKDQICVTLDNSVYFFNSNNKNSKHIITNIEVPSSCGYISDGNKVAIGTRSGNIYVINSDTFQAEGSMQISDSTLSIIRNTSHKTLIGDQDGNILRFDSRCPTNLDVISAHESEICNIAISGDGNHFATGSNENSVKIWDFRALSSPYSSYCEHSAAVRAIAFSKINPDLIVSGGGTTDKTIRIWDINTCITSKTVQTGSQICNLIWNERYDTILSTHGFSQNSICLWNAQLKLMNSIKIHKNRVLYSCSSPESTHVLTAAPHDKVYIWKLFPKHESMSVQQIFSLR